MVNQDIVVSHWWKRRCYFVFRPLSKLPNRAISNMLIGDMSVFESTQICINTLCKRASHSFFSNVQCMCREVSTIATTIGIALRPSVDSHYTCVSNQIQAAVAKICLLVRNMLIGDMSVFESTQIWYKSYSRLKVKRIWYTLSVFNITLVWQLSDFRTQQTVRIPK
jgi:hypothetical protein